MSFDLDNIEIHVSDYLLTIPVIVLDIILHINIQLLNLQDGHIGYATFFTIKTSNSQFFFNEFSHEKNLDITSLLLN